MPDNRISTSLTYKARDAVMQALATIREKLPFLIDLTSQERRKMQKSRNAEPRLYTLRAFYLEEMRRDVEPYEVCIQCCYL